MVVGQAELQLPPVTAITGHPDHPSARGHPGLKLPWITEQGRHLPEIADDLDLVAQENPSRQRLRQRIPRRSSSPRA